MYAVRADDGTLIWKRNLGELTGLDVTVPLPNVTALVSVSTPTVAGDKLIVGIYGPAYVIAVDRETGELVWMREVDDHFAAAVTMSGTYYKGYV